MATKSFLKNIIIKNRKSANDFLSALEHAEGKNRKDVKFKVPVKTIKDENVIRKMFAGEN